MSKIKPFWRIMIGLAIFFNFVYSSSAMNIGLGSFFSFAFWGAALAAYIFLCVKIKYDDPLRSMRDLMARQQEEQAARQQEEQVAAAARREADRAEQAARQAEWDRTHGRIVTAIAGVTFNNDDGSSRQAILKDIKARGGDAEVELEEFEYKGKPAVRVLIDGEQIGNIPRSRVQDVLAAMDAGLTSASLDVETFRPEDEEDDEGNVRRRGELIYRADLTLIYNK